MEDVVNCLQVLYPQVDVVFLFDHCQRHARKQTGALNAHLTGRAYGVVHPIMSGTTTLNAEGYLGPHSPHLNVGDTLTFTVEADDCGPWHLTPKQRKLQRHNRRTGEIKGVKRSKKILLKGLSSRYWSKISAATPESVRTSGLRNFPRHRSF
jgi:hypothetical protein